MSTTNEIRDVAVERGIGTPVYSRVSWGAIFAGVAVAFAAALLLNLFGLAIGLSVGDRVGDIGTPTAIWAILASLIALFIGGWITSQCTVGESKSEAVFYGVVVWGVLFVAQAWMATAGMRMGLNAMVAGAPEETQTQVTSFRGPMDQTQDQQARENVTTAAWWAFGGVLLSMLAAIGGSITGAATPRVLDQRRVPIRT